MWSARQVASVCSVTVATSTPVSTASQSECGVHDMVHICVGSFTPLAYTRRKGTTAFSVSSERHCQKDSFYIAQYPVRWTAQSALHFCLPWQTCSFRHQLGLSGKHSSQAASTRQGKITRISTTVYSQVLIYTAESTGASMERTKMPNLRNGSKGGFEPGLT